MKIIKKYHDYYDTVSSFGIDHNCIYVRDLIVLDKNQKTDILFNLLKISKSPDVGWSYRSPISKKGYHFAKIPIIKKYISKYSYDRTIGWKNGKQFKRIIGDIVQIFPIIIGFCGKLYCMFNVTIYDKLSDKDIFVTDLEKEMPEAYNRLIQNDKNFEIVYKFWISNFNNKESDLIFFEYNVPSFAVDFSKDEIILNPI